MEKKDLVDNKLDKQMQLEINFKGAEFDNFVDISSLNKKLVAIDKTIKNTVESLKKTRKIKGKEEIIENIQVDLRRNSLDNIILIQLYSGLAVNILGGIFVEYLKYLAKKNIEKKKEFDFLDNNSGNLTQITNLISLKNINHSTIEVKFGNNQLIIGNNEHIEITHSIKQLRESMEIQEIENTRIGRIEKLDRGKDNYYITLEGYPKKVPITFQNYLNDEELKEILFERLLVTIIERIKDEEIQHIHILDYTKITPKSIRDYQ